MTAPESARLIAIGVAHAAVLSALHGLCFTEGWSSTDMAEMLSMPGAFALAALDGDRADEPVGFILCRSAGDEAEVVTLAVLPSARGRGVGRALLDAAVKTAQDAEAEALFLEVAADNAAAVALYLGAGFVQVGRRKGYYRDGADALVLRAGITPPPADKS